MSSIIQITCINKIERNNPHENITHVGGVEKGIRWKKTQKEAIKEIEAGQTKFFVYKDSKVAWVIVADNNGNKHLKTENDTTTQNNLLSLTECPI